MGRWVQGYDKTGVKGIFWRFYFMGAVGLFFVFTATFNTIYYDKNKNKAKWIGALLGSIMGMPVYALIANIISFTSWVYILLIVGAGVLWALLTRLIYKNTIVNLE